VYPYGRDGKSDILLLVFELKYFQNDCGSEGAHGRDHDGFGLGLIL